MALTLQWISLTLSAFFLQIIAKENRTCPHQEAILPCRCLQKQEEIQIWCSHSNLPKTLEALETVSKYLASPIDELILENNNLPSLPGRAFFSLKIMRLMLRSNRLERVSSNWLMGLENDLMELFIVEPTLRSLPDDSFKTLNKLEAITLKSKLLRRIPDFSELPRLRYIQIESKGLTELSPRHFKRLPHLHTIHITNSNRLARLEGGLLEGLPNLSLINISYCEVSWIHPRAISHLPSLTDLILTENKITEAAMIGRSIKDLPNLQNLYLDYNYIEKLGEASFVDLPSLKKLYLSNNKIAELHHGAFHKVPQLRFIDLTRNLVRQVHPESFLQHSGSGLEELWLVQNDITHIAEVKSLLTALPRLTFLDLSYNSLDAIPFGALRGHPTLERLHLDHNKLRIIDKEAFMAMPALTELRLKNNSLSDILIGPLWNLPNLKGLDLSDNYIQRLEPQFLENLPSLRRIDLSGNGLVEIEPNAFVETPLLEHINISHNEISSIHPATFSHLSNLYELDAHFNRLKHFIPGLPTTVENLYFSDNQIEYIPTPLSPDINLPHLKTLDLSMNRIHKIPSGIMQSLPQLKKLLIGKNELAELESNTFRRLSQLEHLDLNRNRISQVDDSAFAELNDMKELIIPDNNLHGLSVAIIQAMPHLEHLDISRNKLKEFSPETFEKSRDVQILKASYNLLTDLPASMFGLKKLYLLDLSFNRFRIISPDVLKTLTSLSELNLSHNLITELKPNAFENLPSLTILNLQNNELEVIRPNAFKMLPRLKRLNLSQNKIQTIPNRAFNNLPALQVLEIQDNNIHKIAENAFFLMPNVLLLNLSNNLLSSVEDAGIQSLRSLELLDLSYNELIKITSDSFVLMEWLVELNIDNNKICIIHGMPFDLMYRLKVLSIRNNRLLSFPEDAVKKLRGNLEIIDLNGNPLVCSCNLLWLKTWVEENFQRGPTCQDGSLLREIRMSQQECDQDKSRINPVIPGCEDDQDFDNRLLGTSQVFAQKNNLKRNKTENKIEDTPNELAPSPQESGYFYEEYVDLPVNESMMESMKMENGHFPQSSHVIPGDTPTLYAATQNKSNTKTTPDIPRNITNSPSSSGFTFFGLPLGNFGLNKLWNSRGRMTSLSPKLDEEFEKKKAMILKNALPKFKLPEFQEGFIPVVPGTGGFSPIPGPDFLNETEFKKDIASPFKKGEAITLSGVRKSIEETYNYETSTVEDKPASTEGPGNQFFTKLDIKPTMNYEQIDNKSNLGINEDFFSSPPSFLPPLLSSEKEGSSNKEEMTFNTSVIQKPEEHTLIDDIIQKTEELKKSTSQMFNFTPSSILTQNKFRNNGKITRITPSQISSPLNSNNDESSTSTVTPTKKQRKLKLNEKMVTENNQEENQDDWYFVNYNSNKLGETQKTTAQNSSEGRNGNIKNIHEYVWKRKLVIVGLVIVYNHVMYS